MLGDFRGAVSFSRWIKPGAHRLNFPEPDFWGFVIHVRGLAMV